MKRVAVAATGLLAALYFVGVPANPAGFFVDESSIAYNAYTIAQNGLDEHGIRWPLFFRAFGEYKSPIYVYLLAGIYGIAGPSIGAARLLSAGAGVVAATLLGLLAARITGSIRTGIVLFITALLTPWIFELSRLVFEVALVPALIAAFLLLVHDASRHQEWTWPRAAALAAMLGLITYSYSVGRLWAPLFAFGLILLAPVRNLARTALRVWIVYGLLLLPFLGYVWLNPGALGQRFQAVTFLNSETSVTGVAWRFLTNYIGNFDPRYWLLRGDPEPRHHLAGMGSLLVGTAGFAAIGLGVVLARDWRDRWWRFVLYGLAVSALPAALTIDRFHTLRLAAAPIFVLALAALGIAWLAREAGRARAATLLGLIAVTVLQGLAFQWQFHRAGSERWHSFDAYYPEVFAAALAQPNRPIHLIDGVGTGAYIHAYWYGALRGLDRSLFVRLPTDARPPPGTLVISAEVPCANCTVILQRSAFRAYVTH